MTILPQGTADSEPSWFGFLITLRENAPSNRVVLLRYLAQHRIGTRLLFASNVTRQPLHEGPRVPRQRRPGGGQRDHRTQLLDRRLSRADNRDAGLRHRSDRCVSRGGILNTPLPLIPSEDHEHILRHTAKLWPDLAGARCSITGGTGFYGKCLLESIAATNDQLGANVRAALVSRNLERFASALPHLASRPKFSWLTGDTASFAFPKGHFDYVFHFATASAAEVEAGGTAILMHTLRGTERVLQFAISRGVRRLLFASSGAVYGRQSAELSHIPEDYRGVPDPTDPASGDGEMKRMRELLFVKSGVDCVIARGFAFVSPYLPLTDKFALGSFIRDALAGGPIIVRGDGRTIRSYMHAADLIVWLLTIVVRGKARRAYNVGSDDAVSILQLANRIAQCPVAPRDVEARGAALGSPPDRYVPDISRARNELGLKVAIGFDLAMVSSYSALGASWQQATDEEMGGLLA